MNRHKGFSLIELLAILALMASMLAVLTPLFNGLVRQTPQVYNASAANTQLVKVLRQVRQDAEAAMSVEVKVESGTEAYGIRFILADGIVEHTYHPDDEFYTRRVIGDDLSTMDQENTWSLPNAVFSSEIDEREKGTLLILHCGFKRLQTGEKPLALANTHVFCVKDAREER